MNENSEYRTRQAYWRGVGNRKAREAWASFLASYSWDAFFTATPKSSSTRKHPISLLGQISRNLCSVAPVSRLFVAAEEFKLGGWHCHGLVSWYNEYQEYLISSRINDAKQRLSGIGYCIVEPAKQALAVARYVSKYIVKDTPWEYDILGSDWHLDKE